jgi:CheY-like chemotaxis protein
MTYRVLIADDASNHRRSLSISLRMEGFEVLEASDGQRALDVMAHGAVDVVVCDLMMPRIDGLELARRLQLHYPATGVILTSAYHLTRLQLERAEVADIHFLPKPYPFAELMRLLGECVPAMAMGRTTSSQPRAVSL